MTDDTNGKYGKDDALSKYGYDPLDDIKPIDTDDYRKNADDTFADPILDADEVARQKKMQPKAAPVSALEAKDQKEDVNWQEYKDQVFKGDYFNLMKRDPTLRQLIVGAGWEQRSIEKDPIDIDLSCFLIDRGDKTRVDEDFVFYNNPSGCDGAVKLLEDSRGGAGDGDDERLFIDLNGLPFDILRIVFAISIYDQELKGHDFHDVRDLYLRVVNYDSGEEVARYIVPDDEKKGFNGMYAAVMVREGPEWFLQPIGEMVKGSLSPIARKYGLLIAEETG